MDGRKPGRGRHCAAVDDDSGHRSDSGPRDPGGNRRDRAFSDVSALGQLRRIGADERRHGGPRRAATLQPACNHVLRWAFLEAVHGVQRTKGPQRLPAAAALRAAVWLRAGRRAARVRPKWLSPTSFPKWSTWCGPSACHTPIRRRHGLAAVQGDVNPRSPPLRRQHCARTSPVTLWSAAGQPSARPVRNWAVRCRIPILCRAGRWRPATRKSGATAAPTRRDSWFYTNREMLSDRTGLSQLGHKLIRRIAGS